MEERVESEAVVDVFHDAVEAAYTDFAYVQTKADLEGRAAFIGGVLHVLERIVRSYTLRDTKLCSDARALLMKYNALADEIYQQKLEWVSDE